MPDLTDFTDVLISKGSQPSAEAHYTLLVEEEAALRLGSYGTREPNGITPHNHASNGGELLTRSIAAIALGPYARPGSGLSPTVGVPCYPPATDVDFTTTKKLLLHAGIYLAGGVSAIRVRIGVRFTGAGSRSLQLKCIVRPTQKLGFSYDAATYQVTIPGTMSTTGANDFINSVFTLSGLDVLGGINVGRWYELLIVLQTNPTATTTPRLLGFQVTPVLFADQVPPNVIGLPRVTIDPRDMQQGAGLVESFFGLARALFDGMIYAVLGRIPGKVVQWGSPLPLEDKSQPYRVEVIEENAGTGVHQHTGAAYYDGALIPRQVALIVPINDMGDDASNTMNAQPMKGALIDPTAAGQSTLRKFRARVSVARGDTRFIVRLAVSPRHDEASGFLWMLVRSYQVSSPDSSGDFSSDIITGLEVGQQNQEFAKVGTYFLVQVQPENADVFTPNEARAAMGNLGHWTIAARLPTLLLPTDALGPDSNLYRASKAITLKVDPDGRTGEVVFEFLFYLLNQSGTAKSSPTLQWLAIARPEET